RRANWAATRSSACVTTRRRSRRASPRFCVTERPFMWKWPPAEANRRLGPDPAKAGVVDEEAGSSFGSGPRARVKIGVRLRLRARNRFGMYGRTQQVGEGQTFQGRD